MTDKPRYIRWFNEITMNDVPLVGGKNASLGDMYRELTPRGVRVPNGYPEFAAFLVKEVIDSISLNPDSIMRITLRVLEMERELRQKAG